MKRIKTGVMLILPLLVLAGCGVLNTSAHNAGDIFIAAEWNVQALFDGFEEGNEYREYLETAGWTKEKYAARITAISQAIPQMIREGQVPGTAVLGTDVPGLIGFIEIENAAILENLAEVLSKHGYIATAFASLPGSSLGIGFLSRFPFTDVRTHSITVGKDTAPRPVLEVRLEPGGKPLVFMLCHWKSKLGGDEATENLRRSSARVVRRRLLELNETDPGMPVIVMGDLNENHDEFYRRGTLSALLPDDPLAAEIAVRDGAKGFRDAAISPDDVLVLCGEKPPVSRYFLDSSGRVIPAFYSPWYGDLGEGSYYYKGDWETIDHFLLSEGLFDGMGWEYEDCRALNYAPFTASDGAPAVYVPRSGRGLSDHLPLVLYLRDLD